MTKITKFPLYLEYQGIFWENIFLKVYKSIYDQKDNFIRRLQTVQYSYCNRIKPMFYVNSCPAEIFCKQGFLKNFTNFTWNF